MSKTVLITGCSDNGLGSALAIAYQQTGKYKVIATARNLKKLGKATAAGCETIQLDVLSEDSIHACVEEVRKRYGKLDILVNNAGAMCALPILDVKLQDVRNVFELNVFTLITMTRAFLPVLRHGGWIINNTSAAGMVPVPFQGVYAASKAAALNLTQVLRLELEPLNIKVVELRTAAVKSVIFSNVDRATLPEDSPYILAKDVIEEHMNGGPAMKTAIPADQWARQVISDLGTTSPPKIVGRGTSSSLIPLIPFLPGWLLDMMMRKMGGLDVFTKRLSASKAKTA